jgi:hypothetical protein
MVPVELMPKSSVSNPTMIIILLQVLNSSKISQVLQESVQQGGCRVFSARKKVMVHQHNNRIGVSKTKCCIFQV